MLHDKNVSFEEFIERNRKLGFMPHMSILEKPKLRYERTRQDILGHYSSTSWWEPQR